MKRLKSKLLSMDPKTGTYKEMYEGCIVIEDPASGMPPVMGYDPIYYHDDIGFEISRTHKLAQDKPTVVINIPCTALGIKMPDPRHRIAVADYCLRVFTRYIDQLNAALYNRNRPDNENGKYYICHPNGEILCRNSSYFAVCPQKDYIHRSGSVVQVINDGAQRPPTACLCLRLQVQLPKNKIRKSIQMLCRDLPEAVDRFVAEFDTAVFGQIVELTERQVAIRNFLKQSDYCAFIANGSILPRDKGTHLPLPSAVAFRSVPEDEIEICGVRGMGIKKGVTVITGGGYSGKSTLLDAIAAGIYDHVLGDGRELCITDESAVTICAEDGRSIKHINISPFIKWLPSGDTADFSTTHASGSTSQAANIMEAIDCGATLLLIDEDKSATNFMIRDGMMKRLIQKEPITPFTDRVKELFSLRGVSTILVIGGSGEYLSVADRIYMMEEYSVCDVTAKAKELSTVSGTEVMLPTAADWEQSRTLYAEGFSSYPEGSGSEKLQVSDMGFIIIGDEAVDVRALHNIVSVHQLTALGFMLRYLEISNNERTVDLTSGIDQMYRRIEQEGLDFLYSSFFTNCQRFLDLPRKQEMIALINRMRRINMVKGEGDRL